MSEPRRVTVPYTGRILISHLAAYGLAVALDDQGLEPFVGHDDSGEFTPFVEAICDETRLAEAISASAAACEAAVETDIEPGRSGNDRIPAIRARATAETSARAALAAREDLLDGLERQQESLALGLVAGLGAPAVWLRTQNKCTPQRGATALDGVPLNVGSDIVRGSLRRSLPTARDLTAGDMASLSAREAELDEDSEDRTRWSPPGTRVAVVWQWLASLGLTLLPVGLRAGSAARTPGAIPGSDGRIALPVLETPASLPRLRAVLLLRDLTDRKDRAAAARLHAQGVVDVLEFPRIDASSGTMVSYSFGLARPREV